MLIEFYSGVKFLLLLAAILSLFYAYRPACSSIKDETKVKKKKRKAVCASCWCASPSPLLHIHYVRTSHYKTEPKIHWRNWKGDPKTRRNFYKCHRCFMGDMGPCSGPPDPPAPPPNPFDAISAYGLPMPPNHYHPADGYLRMSPCCLFFARQIGVFHLRVAGEYSGKVFVGDRFEPSHSCAPAHCTLVHMNNVFCFWIR